MIINLQLSGQKVILNASFGVPGFSAYQIAVQQGFIGTVEDWLESLKGDAGGVDGLSAYEVAVANGFDGTEITWLASLNGEDGEQGLQGDSGNDGLSAYEVAVANGFDGTEVTWLASLNGEDGEQGLQGNTGAQGLQGDSGNDGLSAYELALQTGFTGSLNDFLYPRGTLLFRQEYFGYQTVDRVIPFNTADYPNADENSVAKITIISAGNAGANRLGSGNAMGGMGGVYAVFIIPFANIGAETITLGRPGQGKPRGSADSNGYTANACVITQNNQAAGYSVQINVGAAATHSALGVATPAISGTAAYGMEYGVSAVAPTQVSAANVSSNGGSTTGGAVGGSVSSVVGQGSRVGGRARRLFKKAGNSSSNDGAVDATVGEIGCGGGSAVMGAASASGGPAWALVEVLK